MPIQNPGSGATVSGSVAVAENCHYISQQILEAEITDNPIILIPATEEKIARAYWIFNNSGAVATIQLGLNPGLILPLEPGTLYEGKDSGGTVNQLSLISGKVSGILKLASALPEEPEEQEPTQLIFAPLSHPDILACTAGNTVFATPNTTTSRPISFDYSAYQFGSGEVIAVI